ncbi:hypothetical protein SETIT_2G317000v2 [Setaria italica]|uniref:F-box domain-containing protein n=1 Tax=Setaria italica TaxID=4555 RepID=K4A2L3_SETIT|nr:hypothetical protein SETIT_2G317000v2 [Setaria italica]
MTACRDCLRYQSETPRRRGGPHLQPEHLLPDDYGGEEDRLGALPDDLLLDVLARLRCARAAARAGLLARRWRGLWTRLPDLVFHDTALERPLLSALARVAGPVASLVVIREHDGHIWPAQARISSSLRAAASKVFPQGLLVGVRVRRRARATAIELPCFDRTTAVELRVSRGRFKLPAAGGFPVLANLSLDCGHIDLGELLRRCSRLRKLLISDRRDGWIAVHSQSLEELDVHVHDFVQLRRIDIVAPALKKLRFNAGAGIDTSDFGLSFSAPVVEEVSWQCSCHSTTDRTQKQHASSSESACEHQLQHRSRVLSLDICTYDWHGAAQKFGKEMSRFLFTNFSILELDIRITGHVCGDMLLRLLGLSTSIQRLKSVSEACTVSCHCDEPNNWRSQSISLAELKEVEIQGFEGKDNEIDLLEVLLRCGTMLERVTIRLSSKISQSDRGT